MLPPTASLPSEIDLLTVNLGSPLALPQPEEESDEVLLVRLARQEVDALDTLYARHGRTAFSVAYRILNSAEAAEDVVQDAFLAVWRRAESYQPERGNARAWLLSVVRHRAIDTIRARAARPRTAPIENMTVLAAPNMDPCEDALRAVEAESVRAALAVLPAEQRQTVELAFFGGLTYPEIAERTGVPLGTVKSRVRLALERLRTALTQPPAAPRRTSGRAGYGPNCSAMRPYLAAAR